MSLRLSMILSIAAMLVATLLIGSGVIYFHAVTRVEAEMKSALSVGERIARGNIEELALHPDEGTRRLHALVSDFDGDRHLRAELLEKNGEPALSSRPGQAVDPAPDWVRQLLGGGQSKMVLNLSPDVNGFDRIVLYADAQNEIGEVWSDVRNSLMLLFAFSALTLSLLLWMIGRILGPLSGLSRAFTEVGGGYFGARMPEAGPAELRAVYRGFNEMTARLETAEAENIRLQKQLAAVQDEERAQLARDLHDEFGSVLFAAEVDAVSAERHVAEQRLAEVRFSIGRIREALGGLQRQVREMLSRLRQGPLLDAGLAAAIESLVDFWRGRRPDISFTLTLSSESYGEPLDETVYRIVQEGLSNAVRHGNPTRIDVGIVDNDETVEIVVRDDGKGFGATPNSAGQGLKGMRERARNVGGELRAISASDHSGVEIRALLPCKRGPRVPDKKSVSDQLVNL